MAFITDTSGIVSFAEYDDVFAQDKRVFDSNEGLTDEVIESALMRATERLLNKFRSTEWWRTYWLKRSSDTSSVRTVADIPQLDPSRIKARQSDFTELCVAFALAEYILPQVADFGGEDDNEWNKMGHYSKRANEMFAELVNVGDWYDFDDDGEILSVEKQPGNYTLKRVR